MDVVGRILRAPTTYRRLTYLLSAVPLGLVWFVSLVTVWSLCLGLAITPLVIPLLFVLAAMTRGFAAVEAEIARSLLDVHAKAPAWPPGSVGLWARVRGMFGAGFWRAQGYLLIRWFAGFPVGIAIFSLIAGALGLIFAPVWVPLKHGGIQLGIWRPHTFIQSLGLVPIGLLLLAASLLVVTPLASLFRPLASGLLPDWTLETADRRVELASRMAPLDLAPRKAPRRALTVHAAAAASIVLGLAVLWAVTSRGYFWPVWVMLPLAVALAIHGWFVLIEERPSLLKRFRGSRALAASAGVGGVITLFFIAVWAITSQGYFWPKWPIVAIATVLAIQTAAALLSSPDQAEMAERIETLESTRAGAVDLQESELRRIERDLHDGAQARLVALGMSLGMAEQKLSEDPQRAGELLAEARAGAEHALRELRDLARGIHPPVLADRGLDAALLSLANSTPLKVTLSIQVPERPPAVVETTAYFVAAEALANAAKHARAETVSIEITRVDHALELEVTDDGVGGADPDGAGLLGLRQRVAALDGTLEVRSPPGGPTTIRARLPCA
jgi:signal transduction histidine kinase